MRKTIRVATYNVLHSYNPAQIATNIKQMADSGVDVFALQEVLKDEGKEFILDVILKKLGETWKAEYSLIPVYSWRTWGTAILYNSKKIKLLEARKIDMKKMDRLSILNSVLSRVIMGGKGKVYPRTFINAKLSFDAHVFYFSSIHPEFFSDTAWRLRELYNFLNKKIKTKEDDAEIIAGDFNTVDLLNTHLERKLIQKVLGNGYTEASAAIPWSVDIMNVSEKFATPMFLLLKKFLFFHVYRKFDYIWIKNLKLVEARSLKLPGSDHLPIIAELEFK